MAVIDFPFFDALYRHYKKHKGQIRTHYRRLSREILDFNDPSSPTSFLRRPQFEALEIYVFLKERADNAHLDDLFEQWYRGGEAFQEGRVLAGRLGEQLSFDRDLDLSDPDTHQAIFEHLGKNREAYPNYIFALTMGTGKTILMATCIFYEFLLANKWPTDPRYCHNALVFAPDKTVLQSLREIQTFDLSKVVPPEYVDFLSANLKIHFLDDAGMGLGTQDGSRFNIVISNAQKIILKRQSAEKSLPDRLYGLDRVGVDGQSADLHGWMPEDEESLKVNARFQKLGRLPQLGIYVDEAHHALGTKLAGDFDKTRPSRLRQTINRLAQDLRGIAGSRVVACYNYTGTPYVRDTIMPEVVYAYGLSEAIRNAYLKKTAITGYDHARSDEFVRLVIRDFWEKEGEERREGMLPKLAFFAATIEELDTRLRPAVEETLSELGIPLDRILVNVGDKKLTSKEDEREFRRLDFPESEKQFILLVNKGREGWNCRSLFGVALYRKPKSRIFVLQASMRCLRAIGEEQETGRIYLSRENIDILDTELQQNFRVTRADLDEAGRDRREKVDVKIVAPPRTVRIKRVRKLFKAERQEPEGPISFGLDTLDTARYRLTAIHRDTLDANAPSREEDLSSERRQRCFSLYSLVAEIARYFNNEEVPCLFLEELLVQSKDGVEAVLEKVNAFNEILHDRIIPTIFHHLYRTTSYSSPQEEEVALVKPGRDGNTEFRFRGMPDLIADMDAAPYKKHKAKSFHLDHYIFDSTPEKAFFDRVLPSGDIDEIFFTGMLTHGQSDFYVTYIDPETHAVRSYYPDFLVRRKDGSFVIVEIKGDNMIDDAVVRSKADSATQLARESGFEYRMIKGSEAAGGL